MDPKSHINKWYKKKQNVCKYKFIDTQSHIQTEVCQSFISNVLQISKRRIKTIKIIIR